MATNNAPMVVETHRTAIAAVDPRTMPPPALQVTAAIAAGLRSSKLVFPENAPARTIEDWRPPVVTDQATMHELRRRLQNLAKVLGPADRVMLEGRIAVLLAHYRSNDLPDWIEERVADDWADDLADYPLWAITEAARTWRRTKKFKPQISEIVQLCHAACEVYRKERSRIASIVEASEAATNPIVCEVRSIARSLLKPIPGYADPERQTAAEGTRR